MSFKHLYKEAYKNFGTITKVTKNVFNVQDDVVGFVTKYKQEAWIGTKPEVGKRVFFGVNTENKPDFIYVVEVH